MTTPVPVEGGETGTADEGYVQRAIDLDLGGTQFYLKSEVSGLVVLGHLDERIALLVLVKTVGLRRVAHRVSVEDARNVDLNRLSVHGVRMLSDADAEGVNGLHDELEGVTTALLRGIPLQSVLRSMEGFEAALQPTGGGALPSCDPHCRR